MDQDFGNGRTAGHGLLDSPVMTSAPAPQGLGRRAVRGVAVTAGAQALRMVLQIASVVVLARLLTPDDYGLVAMVLAVVGIAELFRDLGLSPAAIRAETLSVKERDNLFWINTGLGASLGTVVAVAAPLVAMAYGRSELTAITLALAPTYLLSGFMTQYRVHLTRGLRFGALAAIDVVCAAVPLLIGVIAAYLGASYWALVIQQLSSGLLGCVLLVAACRWRPHRYDRGTPVEPFLRLGASFVFGGVMAYITRNADNVLIGHQFGASPLGLYTRSVQLVRTPLAQLQAPFGTVALPVLANAGDDDERMLSAAHRGQVALLYPVLALVAVLVSSSSAVVSIALGPQWSGAAPIMAWVALSGGLSCVTMPVLWMYAARGLGRAITRYNSIAAVLSLSAMVVGLRWGVEGVAAGVAVATAFTWPLALWFLKSEGRVPVSVLAWSGLRVVGLAALAGGCVVQVRGWTSVGSPAAQLALACLIVGAVFLVAWVVPAFGRDYAHIRTMALHLRRRSTSMDVPDGRVG